MATAIGGSFIKLCGPVLAVFQLSAVMVGVVGVPGTEGTVPGTVPLVGVNSGDATKGKPVPPLPKSDGSVRREENAEKQSQLK